MTTAIHCDEDPFDVASLVLPTVPKLAKAPKLCKRYFVKYQLKVPGGSPADVRVGPFKSERKADDFIVDTMYLPAVVPGTPELEEEMCNG